MIGIINKIWFFIILFTGYQVFEKYEIQQESIENARRRIPVVKRKIKKAKKEKQDLKTYFEDIEEAKNKIEKVASEVESLQRKFPSEISDTENLALISSIAESLNIKNIFLKPGEEASRDFYISKLYNVRAEGTFLQFVIFLEKVSEAERLMNISDMKLSNIARKQKGRFQLINGEINIETYKYNPNFRESRGIDEIQKQFDSKKPVKKRRRRRKRKGKV